MAHSLCPSQGFRPPNGSFLLPCRSSLPRDVAISEQLPSCYEFLLSVNSTTGFVGNLQTAWQLLLHRITWVGVMLTEPDLNRILMLCLYTINVDSDSTSNKHFHYHHNYHQCNYKCQFFGGLNVGHLCFRRRKRWGAERDERETLTRNETFKDVNLFWIQFLSRSKMNNSLCNVADVSWDWTNEP